MATLFSSSSPPLTSLKIERLASSSIFRALCISSSVIRFAPSSRLCPLQLTFLSSPISNFPSDTIRTCFKNSYSRFRNSEPDDHEGISIVTFDEAVTLFNAKEFYTCHDVLEALWHDADDPIRTLYHGILQCAVGFHHLFNQNHKGAMMELGEGLCKLRKMNFKTGPFHQFELEINTTLDFIYQTQIELAACAEDLCIAMDQTERSYQLLGGYAAGQNLYCLEIDFSGVSYIVFRPERSSAVVEPAVRVKLPTLEASQEHIARIL